MPPHIDTEWLSTTRNNVNVCHNSNNIHFFKGRNVFFYYAVANFLFGKFGGVKKWHSSADC